MRKGTLCGRVPFAPSEGGGEDPEEVLPALSKEKQYRLGRGAGEILRATHALPPDASDVPKVAGIRKHAARIIEDYDFFQTLIPKWHASAVTSR